LQTERDPVPPGRLVDPQPVMPETVRLYWAEVEQFRFVLLPDQVDKWWRFSTIQIRA